MPNPPPDEPREGEVWDVTFGPGLSPEQVGVRPALVISNDWFNGTGNYLFIIVPITGTDRDIPSQVRIGGREGGLRKNSVLMCEQIRAISSRRFLSRRGRVSPETLAVVRRIVDLCVHEVPPGHSDRTS
ncbi:MAG: type II toxin-antitoxin system PemK/MazF family toxin [Thermomicrobiales bacterium]